MNWVGREGTPLEELGERQGHIDALFMHGVLKTKVCLCVCLVLGKGS